MASASNHSGEQLPKPGHSEDRHPSGAANNGKPTSVEDAWPTDDGLHGNEEIPDINRPGSEHAVPLSVASLSGPTNTAGGDVVYGGGGMDGIDDLPGRRPRNIGLRALAQVREMSTLHHRRSRSGLKRHCSGSTARIFLQPAIGADGE
ncbi:hypothetical protein MTO96_031346 [Rhipicephalus appendiculatus]